MSAYRVFAVWTETREREFDSLDDASEWARSLLAEEPQASIQVNADDFVGSWFTPVKLKTPVKAA